MIVSCYTAGTLYEREACRLIASCGALGLPVLARAYASRGDWHANVAFKASFLRDLRNELDGPILYVDADAVLHSNPWPWINKHAWAADIGARIRMGRVLSGTLLIRDSDKALKVLDTWCQINADDPARHGKGQMNLQHALNQLQAAAAVTDESKHMDAWPPIFVDLGVSMCYIFDTDARENEGVEPVIEHLQASRDGNASSHSAEQRTRRQIRIMEIEAELYAAADANAD